MNTSVTKKFENLYKRMMSREESVIVEIIDGCKFVAKMKVMDFPLSKDGKAYLWWIEYFRKTEKGYWKKLYRCSTGMSREAGVEFLVDDLKNAIFDFYYNDWIRLGKEEKKTWLRLFEESEDAWNNNVDMVKDKVKNYYDPSKWTSKLISFGIC